MTQIRQRWYATRSGHGARTDEDRAMAHEQIGPFGSREEAKMALAGHLIDELTREQRYRSWQGMRRTAAILHELCSDGPAFEHDNDFRAGGITWRLWSTEPEASEREAPTVVELAGAIAAKRAEFAPVSESLQGAVVHNAELSPAMKQALYMAQVDEDGDGTPCRSLSRTTRVGTVVALIRRGLATTGSVNYLTKAGQSARDRLVGVSTDEPKLPPIAGPALPAVADGKDQKPGHGKGKGIQWTIWHADVPLEG